VLSRCTFDSRLISLAGTTPVINKVIHFSMIPLQVKLPKPPEQEEKSWP
jgi:hypothetical protein